MDGGIFNTDRTTTLLLKDCHGALSRATYWLPVEGMGTSNSSTLTAVLAKTRWIQAHQFALNRNERELLSSHNQLLSLWKYPSLVKVAELTGHTSLVLHMAQMDARLHMQHGMKL
ncbi:hypothetical protein ACS0TY_002050 [Phlomoides rotata]